MVYVDHTVKYRPQRIEIKSQAEKPETVSAATETVEGEPSEKRGRKKNDK
jgi:hypothetical protein